VSGNPTSNPGTGYGGLARRIARRTTDLLAIALVLVAGIGLGGQLIGWWRSEPQARLQNPGAEATSWERDGVPLDLQFGDSPFALERTPVSGGREAAAQRLVDSCAAAADSPASQSRPISSDEQRLIAAAEALEPVREEHGRWRVYVVDGPVLQAVVIDSTMRAPSGFGSAASGSLAGDVQSAEPLDEHQTHATASPRVLCWGLAFPADEHRWIVYTFRRRPDLAASGAQSLSLKPSTAH
jgi:hypothetical protein